MTFRIYGWGGEPEAEKFNAEKGDYHLHCRFLHDWEKCRASGRDSNAPALFAKKVHYFNVRHCQILTNVRNFRFDQAS